MIAGDTVALSGQASVSSADVGHYSAWASSSLALDNSNYTLTGGAVDVRITPAPLIVTAANQQKQQGQAFTFQGNEFAASGLVNGETIGRADLASAGGPAPAVAGNYPITIANAGGGSFNPANYSISYRPGSMKVIGQAPPAPPELPQPAIVSPYQWLSFANGVAVDPERPLSKVEYDPMAQRDAVQWLESYLADTSLVDPAMLSGIVEYKPLEVEISFDQYWSLRGNPAK